MRRHGSRAVANCLIERAKEEGGFVTSMRLLKLVCIAHGWNLAIRERPLVREAAGAWKYDPVIPDLCHGVKRWGAGFVRRRLLAASFLFCAPAILAAANHQGIRAVLDSSCVGCHSGSAAEGGLNLLELEWDIADLDNRQRWVLVHDRVSKGEMPPVPGLLSGADRETLVAELSRAVGSVEADETRRDGRASIRRLNRIEYQNTLQDLLHLRYLNVVQMLPRDGEAHGFAKVGEALDISGVQVNAYLDAAEMALRLALEFPAERPPAKVSRHYARAQKGMVALNGNSLWNRWWLALDGLRINEDHSWQKELKARTVGEADPEKRESESVAVFRGPYQPYQYSFNQGLVAYSGDYRVRVKLRSVLRQTDMAEPGPNPRFFPEGDPTGKWDFLEPAADRIYEGKRSEPVSFYAMYTGNGDEGSVNPTTDHVRFLATVEAPPDQPRTLQFEAYLRRGEILRPDTIGLPRPMVPALPETIQQFDPDGFPGVAFHWVEIEGPLAEQWPPASYGALFGNLPFRQVEGVQRVEAVPQDPRGDAAALLRDFMERAYRHPPRERETEGFFAIADGLLAEGVPFTEAMITTYAAVLSSPRFLFMSQDPGRLDDYGLAERLALFLTDAGPDEELLALAGGGRLGIPEVLRDQVDRLLDRGRADRFFHGFLNDWLGLDEIRVTEPDRTLFPEYAGDDWLVDSMVAETRLFFADLVARDLPARNIVDSDYTFLNERLASHYGVDGIRGPALRRTPLPDGNPHGGILTQASVLKVTANGAGTSPVVRGAWVKERIEGEPPPPPPPGIPSVEPDTRGATTIRELLARHRDDRACAACHARIDPPGLALENFDVMGAWRENYRSLGEGERVEGRGRSGNNFVYYVGKPIDASGQLRDGRAFRDIHGFKALLLADERRIAKNLAEQLTVYATGARVRFSDREAIAGILDRSAASEYGVRTMIHEIVQSTLFRNK